MTDYYAAATVRFANAEPKSPYSLWTRRILAENLTDARHIAISEIQAEGMIYAELQILWSAADPLLSISHKMTEGKA